ncbi:MAG: DUF1559 domain-containing protein [Cytophagaceae bacterium]|nr:MAG: DUF1559 domain-containing protein [Cytophagaceae bacterium]
MVPITAAIMFPVFARARENARRSACQSNLKQIGLGSIQYALAHGDRLPTGTTLSQWQTQIAPYMAGAAKTGNIYHCPSDRTMGDSYEVNPKLAGMALEDIPYPASNPLMWDKSSTEHLNTRNVLFADGHVKALREEVIRGQIAAFSH